MNKFLGIFNRIEQMFVLFGGVLIIILMIMTIIDVSGRFLFRFPLLGSVEISELATAVTIVLAISFTQKMGAHPGMDALLDKFKRMKRPISPIILTFTLLLTEAMFILVLWFVLKSFIISFTEREVSSGPLYVIVWPFRGLFFIGILLVCTRLILQLLSTIPTIKSWSKIQ